jgi:hypothetical protein
MRKSKFIGMTSGTWTCTGISVAYVQPAFKQKKVDGKRVRSKYPGHRIYEYTFDRLTSDRKALKTIKLNAAQVRQVLNGERSVEDFALKKEEQRSFALNKRVSYSFCD